MSDYDRILHLRTVIPYLGLHDDVDDSEILYAVGKLVGQHTVALRLAERIRAEAGTGEVFSDQIFDLVEKLR